MPEQTKQHVKNLRIVKYGAEVLRQRAAKVKRTDFDLPSLAREMEAVMHQADGVGLAAPQIGISLQLAVVDIGDGPIVLINPRIVKSEGEAVFTEGCLSLPGLYGEVTRAAKVVVAASDLSGKSIRIEGEGFLARALQHEIDHLNGHLFIDHVDESTLHWLIKPHVKEGDAADVEPITQPTTLEDALKIFRTRQAS